MAKRDRPPRFDPIRTRKPRTPRAVPSANIDEDSLAKVGVRRCARRVHKLEEKGRKRCQSQDRAGSRFRARARACARQRQTWPIFIATVVVFVTVMSITWCRKRASSRALILKSDLDYYKILGLKPGASNREVKHAYISLSAKWHPDKHMTPAAKERAHERFKKLEEAYRCLSNEVARRQYDTSQLESASNRRRPRNPSTHRLQSQSRSGRSGTRGGRAQSPIYWENSPSEYYQTMDPAPQAAPWPSDSLFSTPFTNVHNNMAEEIFSVTKKAASVLVNAAVSTLTYIGNFVPPNLLGVTVEREITESDSGQLVERVSTFTRRRDGTTVIETNDRILTQREILRLQNGKALNPLRSLASRVLQGSARIAVQLLIVYIIGRILDIFAVLFFLFDS